jgi:peptidoglycan/xylan/chitin deacetylase (PgdA/CDA1 family)
MFTFRKLTILFFLILLCLNYFSFFPVASTGGFVQNHAILLYSLLIGSYLGISFAMAFLPCSGFHHPVICHGDTREKLVALTFDDGPHPEKTPLILDVLKNHQTRATFFCIGLNIIKKNELIKQIHEEGHTLGNHSYSHSKWFDLFPVNRMASELDLTGQLIKNTTGKFPLYFRPPFGVVNPKVSRTMKKLELYAICWNIRSLDTLKRNPEAIMKKIMRKLKPGAIILLHDHTPFTEHHLDQLLKNIREAGYRIVPLEQLLKLPAYVE